MATETLAVDRIQKVFDDLEAQKTLISSCTLLWKNLADQFSSLDKTLTERSQSLDSKLQTLDSQTKQTIESVEHREASIPDRESAAAALIEDCKESIIKEIGDPDAKSPEDVQGFLRWHSRRMDAAGLWRFMISRRKDLAVLRREIFDAIAGSVDSVQLVLDAMQDFLNRPASATASPEGGGGADRCWAVGMLLRALFDSEGRKAPEVSGKLREKAAEIAEAWRAKLEGMGEKGEEKEEGGEEMGGPEAQIFLQMVVAFGLRSRFQEEFLRKLVLEHSSRKEMAKLAAGLGFGEKMADIIDELVKAGKELDAVYFALESGLTERFSPAPLLKSYLQSSRKNANAILKKGNHSTAAIDESSNVELNAIRSIIKCVEYYKLQQTFSVDGIQKRLAQLEKAKADRKRAAASNKSQTKRARVAGPAFRHAKTGRTISAPYASYHRNPPAHQMPPVHHSYNYPVHGGGYDGPTPASYSASHIRSPAMVSQPYYAPEDMGAPRSSGVPYGGPSSVNYGGYDYTAPHSGSTQPQYPH